MSYVTISSDLSPSFRANPKADLGSCIPSCQSIDELVGNDSAAEVVRIASEMTSQFSAADTASDRVRVLNQYFFREGGFRPLGTAHSTEGLLPREVFKNRAGNCVGLAVVYLAIAKQLALPVFPVAAPDHIFIRFDDGRTRFNIELLMRGVNLDDTWYVRQHKVPDASIASGVFLKALSEKEFLGYLYVNLGTIYSEAGEYANAQRLYDAALSQAPKLPSAWYNLATDLLAQGRDRQAVKCLNHSLRLYPTDVRALNNRSLALCREGKLRKARQGFRSALAIDPDFQIAAQNLSTLQCGSKSDRAQ